MASLDLATLPRVNNYKPPKLFQKVPEYWFAFGAALVGLLSISIAIILYASGDRFGLLRIWISNLGIGPYGADWVFNMGVIIMGICLMGLNFGLFFWLKTSTKKAQIFNYLGMITGILGSLGMILVGIFNMNDFLVIHVISGVSFFFPTLFFAVLYTISMSIQKKTSPIQWIFTGFLIVLVCIFVPVYLYSANQFTLSLTQSFATNFEHWIAMMSSMEPEMQWVRFLEWIGAIFVLFWMLQTGIHLKKHIGPTQNLWKMVFQSKNMKQSESNA